jgi:hypothetical protein
MNYRCVTKRIFKKKYFINEVIISKCYPFKAVPFGRQTLLYRRLSSLTATH